MEVTWEECIGVKEHSYRSARNFKWPDCMFALVVSASLVIFLRIISNCLHSLLKQKNGNLEFLAELYVLYDDTCTYCSWERQIVTRAAELDFMSTNLGVCAMCLLWRSCGRMVKYLFLCCSLGKHGRNWVPCLQKKQCRNTLILLQSCILLGLLVHLW